MEFEGKKDNKKGSSRSTSKEKLQVSSNERGEIPVLPAPDLFNNNAHDEAGVETRTQCCLSKAKLDFGLIGETLRVTAWGEAEPIVADTVSIINNSEREYHWQIVQAVQSEKYKVEAFPSSGKVKAKRVAPIAIKFRVFCTTKLTVKLGIMLSPKVSGFFNKQKNKAITATQDVLILSFKVDSDLSLSLDFDELQMGEKIASGGFGTVFRATWRSLVVAVKKLHVQELTPEDKEIFLKEIKLMRMLNCPYVVTLMGSTQIPGQPLCLVMEFIEKGALSKILQNPISEKLKCKIILDIARGMNFMHKNHIFHRDLKPDNILVISDSEDPNIINIKITDFDTARSYLLESDEYRQNYQSFVRAHQSDGDIRTLSNMGTLIFKAPELMGGERPDPSFIDKTDVFSYGVLSYQTFTQKEPYSEPPFNKYTTRELEKFVKEDNRLPIPPNVPKDIAVLIEKCWQPRPRLRPSMEQISQDVQAIYESLPKWSPIVRKPSVTQVDVFNPIPPTDQHSKIGWAGIIERDAAILRLDGCEKGTFLLRWSARALSYVLSHRSLKTGVVEHIADIRPEGERITVVRQNGDKRVFSNLGEYIEAMKRQGIITKPISIDQNYEQTPNIDYAMRSDLR